MPVRSASGQERRVRMHRNERKGTTRASKQGREHGDEVAGVEAEARARRQTCKRNMLT